MDHATFCQALEKLTALPADQAKQAKEISAALTEDDRVEFLEQLTAVDHALAQALAEQSKAVEGLSVAVTNAEKQVTRTERSAKESAQKRKDIEKAEKGISDISSAL